MRYGIIPALLLLLIVSGVVVASEEAAAPAKEVNSVFTGYFGESIWTLVWFLVLLVVLWRVAWKPVLAGLRTRQEYIEKQITNAEQTSGESKKVLADYRQRLANSDQEGKKIIAEHINLAEKRVKEIVDKAVREAEEVKQRAAADIARAQREARHDLMNQAGDIMIRLGKDIFGKTLNDQDNATLVTDAVNRLRQEISENEEKDV